ncbi:histone-lysine N-methyltransferase, H3 lysine-9 specific SUVH4-like isoform X2 [Papaver somniferum]|uniref:histone-lysine N-methyltransferase, H3 lysine-9 specific SUVH4-like isoform X2 n=1 Tax=Papaver somniferum TaxID=3469 RepID=UPI000E6FAC82|nr:histone-lysine N-methyltransferase, H3 lysine-9 specific SUVH4-like isoform X2 [Papaver somniferum]
MKFSIVNESSYLCQGGNYVKVRCRKINDQVMSPGNFALKIPICRTIITKMSLRDSFVGIYHKMGNLVKVTPITGCTRSINVEVDHSLYCNLVILHLCLFFILLYLQVIKYWADRGASKFTIFKFCLKQLQGQPPLTTKQVQYCKAHVPNRIAELHGLVCQVEDKKPLSFQPPI